MASIKALAAIAITLVVACPIGLGYLFAFDEEEMDSWEVSETVNVSDLLLNYETPYFGEYRGTTNNNQLRVSNPDYAGLPGQEQNIWLEPAYISVQNTPVTPYPVTVAGVTKYANVADGWKCPSGYNQISWSNNQINESVRMYLKLTGDSSIIFAAGSWVELSSYPLGIESVSGTVTVKEYDSLGTTVRSSAVLGSYSTLLIEFNKNNTTTVAGIEAMPTMGFMPSTYNRFTTSEYPTDYGGIIESVTFNSENFTNMIFRVDSASAKAGVYPSTYDYTLDMGALYPDKSWSVKLNSIGFYGSFLEFAGVAYMITNGKILVDGHAVPIKGIVLESVKTESGSWANSINGVSVGESEESATTVFGGSWSVTATASILESSTDTELKWQAGQFGFDKESLVAVGLLMAGAAFVVLGMTGRMSGSKVGLLALICGGASIVYLMLL